MSTHPDALNSQKTQLDNYSNNIFATIFNDKARPKLLHWDQMINSELVHSSFLLFGATLFSRRHFGDSILFPE